MDDYKYTKYQTKNPVANWLMRGFYAKIGQIMQELHYQSLLDSGCGDGEALFRLAHLLPAKTVGIDNDEKQIDRARIRFPEIKLETQDIYHLPYENNFFDLVLCLEVLEHLEYPIEVITELARVSSKYLIFSVPHEPFFMLGNLLRGKNILKFGNDPQHINHWNKRTFRQLLSTKVKVNLVINSFPWLIALCEK